MFNKFLHACTCVFAFALAHCAAEAPLREIPDEFYITEHWINWSTTFDIDTREYKLGTVNRRIFDFVPHYDFYDIGGHFQATARMRFWSLTPFFDVNEGSGKQIGYVRQRFFALFPSFDIYTPSGEQLIYARMNFWGTRFTLWDPVSGKEIGHVHRPFFHFKSNWTATITDKEYFKKKNIDPRLFMVVMAYQTDYEHWKRYKDSQNNNNYQYQSGPLAQSELVGSIQKHLIQMQSDPALKDLPAEESVIDQVMQTVDAEFSTDSEEIEEQIEAFYLFCVDLIENGELSLEENKALLTVLEMKLGRFNELMQSLISVDGDASR